MIDVTEQGLYCRPGDFYIDPQKPVRKAIVTHAHADHARWGCEQYLASNSSMQLLRLRLDPNAEFQYAGYGEVLNVNGVRVSFHPAGHILGSAQVRLEYQGQVTVISGDYKLGADPTCEAWEPVRCHRFITESTFGLPVFRWESDELVYREMNEWWRQNRREGKCSILYGYAIGKSQRLLAALDSSIGGIYTHGAVEKGIAAYRASGIQLPPTTHVSLAEKNQAWAGALILAVPGAHGTPWLRRFGKCSTAMASGWMAVRGNRRRRSFDRGFVVSDHVDWPSLLKAVEACEPESVWVTHGYSAVVARFLREQGLDAMSLEGLSRGQNEEDAAVDSPDADLSDGNSVSDAELQS